MNYLGSAIFGYLFGSLPFAYLLVKIIDNKDIRTLGSKNCGATNVYRVSGIKLAVLTASFDALKAGLAFMLVNLLFDVNCAYVAGFCAVLGHCRSVWLKFKGGKGSATGFGLMLFVNPIVGLTGLLVFCITVWKTRYVSMASIVVSIISPFVAYIVDRDVIETIFMAVTGLLVLYMHRPNIKRLINKTEGKIY